MHFLVCKNDLKQMTFSMDDSNIVRKQNKISPTGNRKDRSRCVSLSLCGYL